ncbi:MAG: hypothetical protein NUV54_01460 [Candidatus Taylorbacteria bacterium]|nr:hypothetical protein [Candidatus Taylorbacteria bacterium]
MFKESSGSKRESTKRTETFVGSVRFTDLVPYLLALRIAIPDLAHAQDVLDVGPERYEGAQQLPSLSRKEQVIMDSFFGGQVWTGVYSHEPFDLHAKLQPLVRGTKEKPFIVEADADMVYLKRFLPGEIPIPSHWSVEKGGDVERGAIDMRLGSDIAVETIRTHQGGNTAESFILILPYLYADKGTTKAALRPIDVDLRVVDGPDLGKVLYRAEVPWVKTLHGLDVYSNDFSWDELYTYLTDQVQADITSAFQEEASFHGYLSPLPEKRLHILRSDQQNARTTGHTLIVSQATLKDPNLKLMMTHEAAHDQGDQFAQTREWQEFYNSVPANIRKAFGEETFREGVSGGHSDGSPDELYASFETSLRVPLSHYQRIPEFYSPQFRAWYQKACQVVLIHEKNQTPDRQTPIMTALEERIQYLSAWEGH